MTEPVALGAATQRMRAALSPVLAVGPDFLAGRRDAEEMANTMLRAVREYAEGEQALQHAAERTDEDSAPASAPASASTAAGQLHAALVEIYTCGSGYLADRCDADCVARTMTTIMGEFGDLAPER
ncbi:MAG: hypothetical protein ABI255_11320 [Microbacteriaceae bacterium]